MFRRHRIETFKFSTNLRAGAEGPWHSGVVLDAAPGNALVLSVDEEFQIQELD